MWRQLPECWSAQICEDDVARGKRHNARKCPIALALRRSTGQRVEVRPHSIRIGDRHMAVRGGLLAELVERFDRTGQMHTDMTLTFENTGPTSAVAEPRSRLRPWRR